MGQQKSPARVQPSSGPKSKYSPHSVSQGPAPINALLERLDRVRETGPGRWLARCPAHDDRHPSLSIRETEDGTILIKCWAGCSAADVVSAVGLEPRDLFPDRPETRTALNSGSRVTNCVVWTFRPTPTSAIPNSLVALENREYIEKGAKS